MKAWLLDQPGLEHLHIGEVERPTPDAGELLIKVEAVALNPVTIKSARTATRTGRTHTFSASTSSGKSSKSVRASPISLPVHVSPSIRALETTAASPSMRSSMRVLAPSSRRT